MITKIEKPGYTFYVQKETIIDIDVEPGVHIIRFENAPRVELRNVMKQFPDVKRLEIGKQVRRISISNFMFPNVRWVESDSRFFQSGFGLISENNKLLNAFCLNSDEGLIPIRWVSPMALEGCRAKITYSPSSLNDILSFKGCADMLAPWEGPKIINNVLLSLEKCEEEVFLPKTVKKCLPDLNTRRIDKIRIENLRTLKPVGSIYVPPSHGIIQEVLVENIDLEDIDFLADFPDTQEEYFHIERISVRENPYFKTVDGILYTKNGKKLIWCPSGRKGTVQIPEGVEEIMPFAFYSSRISRVEFPNTLHNIGDEAFSCCEELSSIDFGFGIECLSGKHIFDYCYKLVEISFPPQIKEIGEAAFENCSGLQKIHLNDGLQIIRDHAFRETTLKTVYIPGSVKRIGKEIFSSSLEEVFVENIPNGLIQGICSPQKTTATLTIVLNQQKILLPKNLSHVAIKKLNSQFNLMGDSAAYLDPTNGFANLAYRYSSNYIANQIAAMKIYQEIGSEKARRHLERCAGKTIQLLIREGRDGDLIEFLNLDLAKDQDLEEGLKTAQIHNKASISAYILNKMKHKPKHLSI